MSPTTSGSSPSLLVRYLSACAIVLAAVGVRWLFDPLLGTSVPFITVYPALGIVAFYFGLGPSILALIVGLVGLNYLIAPLRGAISEPRPATAMSVISLFGVGLFIAFGEYRRRDVEKLQESESKLREARVQLENKVQERTVELAASVAQLEKEVETRKNAEQQLRELSGALLRAQDAERRRIARDLHDNTGQILTALKLRLSALQNQIRGDPLQSELASEIQDLAKQSIQDIRTTSHLLHPPLLDELGFKSAAEWLVEGLAERSGLSAKTDLLMLPLPKDIELGLFRILQESLTNAVRHSGSRTVEVRLNSHNGNAVLTVRDYGKGIDPMVLATLQKTGTGLAGMRERLRDLGGQLDVYSDGTGTIITTTIPFSNSQQLN